MSNARELAELAGSYGTGGFVGMKNRIINGAMMIDQRNAGAAISTTAGFPVDRFQMALTAAIGSTFTAQQSSTAPTGFPNSFVWTVGTAGTATGTQSARFNQLIEGYNVADMGFGASGASTFTLSFWVRASVTGTYCVFFNNEALDRSYVAEYTISASNTWEQKTITVAGDISGTWLKTNGTGIRVGWNLGDGPDRNTTAGSWVSGFYTRTSSQTNFIGNAGATFYITGVQLEKGSTATSFDYRPYGTELALCQRYFEKSYDVGIVPGTVAAAGYVIAPTGTNTVASQTVFNGPQYKVNKRISSPTITIYGYNGGTGKVSNASSGADLGASSGTINSYGESCFSVYNNSGGSLATSSYGVIYNWTSSAEL